MAILNRRHSAMPNFLLRIYRAHATQSAGQPGFMYVMPDFRAKSLLTLSKKLVNIFQPEAKLTSLRRKTMNDLVDAVNSQIVCITPSLYPLKAVTDLDRYEVCCGEESRKSGEVYRL